MSVFKQFLVILAGLAGLALLISFVLPSSWEVSREMQIGVPSYEIHAVAGDLDTWSAWSPWSRGVEATGVFTVSPQSTQKGARFEWSGHEIGKGTLELTASDRDKGLEFTLGLGKAREPARGQLLYQELPNGTTMVKFTLRGDVGGNPIRRYLVISRGYTLGPDMVEALSRLKKRVESNM